MGCVRTKLMQNGPFGITSRANIFLAAYSTIESLHLDLDTLDKLESVPAELVQSIKGNLMFIHFHL